MNYDDIFQMVVTVIEAINELVQPLKHCFMFFDWKLLYLVEILAFVNYIYSVVCHAEPI